MGRRQGITVLDMGGGTDSTNGFNCEFEVDWVDRSHGWTRTDTNGVAEWTRWTGATDEHGWTRTDTDFVDEVDEMDRSDGMDIKKVGDVWTNNWSGMDDYGRGGMRLKIVREGMGQTWIRRDAEKIKALKAWRDDYQGVTLRVLGVPFGGPVMGRDEHGEAFYEGTNIWMEIGDTVPVTYVHGYGPDDEWEWQSNPVIIGRAKLVEINGEEGYWYDVQLDEDEPLARRIMEADEELLRASSGAVGHLVRIGQSGLIDVWPVGELALMDVNEWRRPANDWAVVRKGGDTDEHGQARTDMDGRHGQTRTNMDRVDGVDTEGVEEFISAEAGIESGELKMAASCLEIATTCEEYAGLAMTDD